MLVQRCALEQHRLVVPVSITKPLFGECGFTGGFVQSRYRALVDTGAQRTVASHRVIAEQKLMRTGHMQFASLHGPKTHSRFLASVGLWSNRLAEGNAYNPADNAELTLYTIDDPIEVVDMHDNVNFDVILGFDILKRFSFQFNASDRVFELIVQD